MRGDDVDAVTALHLAAFRGFFLSFLGPRFLRELYRAIVDDDECIAYVAVDGACVIGFVAGSGSTGFYRRAAKRRWLRFAFASAGAFLRKPSIAPRLLRALYAPPKTASDGALLMSLAVDPAVQRSGAGRLLTRAFVDGARQRGVAAVVLTTDKLGNDAVNAFYRAQGFSVAAEFTTPEGRAMFEYILYIDENR
ncbi:MAG TPA: GNAT family N-acetyltransferase [Thermoanaerobaculia bacterium]|nr:GNAT family N-acetyltransferase [Thermoanaerobaculia bacterium]